MINKSNIIKSAILSIIVALVYFAGQVISATRIYTYTEDINWETVNAMPHSEAMEYLESKSHTITGVEALLQHIKDPILWYGSALNIVLFALGIFASFMVLLAWVGYKTQADQSFSSGIPHGDHLSNNVSPPGQASE